MRNYNPILSIGSDKEDNGSIHAVVVMGVFSCKYLISMRYGVDGQMLQMIGHNWGGEDFP